MSSSIPHGAFLRAACYYFSISMQSVAPTRDSPSAIWVALGSGRIDSNAGLSTSTYSYDSNGNLTSGAGWGYTWDYLNRMLSSGFGGSTTTYAYDGAGNRVLQTSSTSTTFYPSKFYSFSSMLSGGTTYATSTNYIWNGDTLLATIDQKLVNGTATGTAITRYIHPDHLGSTNAVTDQNGSLVQLLDYYPYGATRVSTSTYPTSEKRDYIGQFFDPNTNLNYLNARFYDNSRGQFVNEDPVFWGKQNLQDPQSLNVYSYSTDNPITKSDPSGKCPWCVAAVLGAGAGLTGQLAVDTFNNYQAHGANLSSYTLSNPQTYLTRAVQGAIIGGSGGALTEYAAGLSLVGQSVIVGGVSGGTSAAANAYLGEKVTPQSVFWDTLLGGASFGLSEWAPAVSGRLPNFGSDAFFTGAHTQQNGLRVGVDAGFNYLSSIFTGLTTSQARVSAANTYNASASSASGKVYVTPSGAVVNGGGQLISRPPQK